VLYWEGQDEFCPVNEAASQVWLVWLGSHLVVGRPLFQQLGTKIWLDADPFLSIGQSPRLCCEENNLLFNFKTLDLYNHTPGSVAEKTRACGAQCLSAAWAQLLLPKQYIENIAHEGSWVARFHTSFKSWDQHIYFIGMIFQ
jgi:hypothetical protein